MICIMFSWLENPSSPYSSGVISPQVVRRTTVTWALKVVWLVLHTSPGYGTTVDGQFGWSGSGPTLAEWTTITFDLSDYRDQGAQIAFSMATDPDVTLAGSYVDAVFIGDSANAPYGP